MRLLFDQATELLHCRLSEASHGHGNACQLPLVVRRLLPGRNDITIDIYSQLCNNVDRCVAAYTVDTVGNRPSDGVNLQDAQLPTTITATVGTLNKTHAVRCFISHTDLLQWMLQFVKVCDLCGACVCVCV